MGRISNKNSWEQKIPRKYVHYSSQYSFSIVLMQNLKEQDGKYFLNKSPTVNVIFVQ